MLLDSGRVGSETAEQPQALLSEGLIISQVAGERCRSRHRPALPLTSREHTEVLGLEDTCRPAGAEFVGEVRDDFLAQPLLKLQPT